MRSTENRRAEGREAEDRAASHLIENGFTVVTRRWKGKRGELDLVVLEGDLLVFVEVKLRRAPGYIPEESIDDAKMRNLAIAAREYLASVGEPDRECRFDLIAIDPAGLRHHRDILV